MKFSRNGINSCISNFEVFNRDTPRKFGSRISWTMRWYYSLPKEPNFSRWKTRRSWKFYRWFIARDGQEMTYHFHKESSYSCTDNFVDQSRRWRFRKSLKWKYRYFCIDFHIHIILHAYIINIIFKLSADFKEDKLWLEL